MLNFLLPTYVIAKWSDWDNDYRFLCTFNRHFISNLGAADKFYFKLFAERALEKHLRNIRDLYRSRAISNCIWHAEDYEVVDYRDLGYEYDEARSTAKYTLVD